MKFDFSPGDQHLLTYWFESIDAKSTTERVYSISIRKYIEFHGMSLSELKEEAHNEEKQGLLGYERQIRYRLMNFRASLKGKAPNTIHGYMTAIRSFYDSQLIWYPKPKKQKTIPILKENKYLGIDKSEIKRILKYANVRDKALTLFIISSGTAAKELVELTKEDFINGLDRDTGICMFHMRRDKTGGDYHTYCTPEASAAIQEYLNTRNDDLPWLFVSRIKKINEIVKMTPNAIGGIYRRLAIKTGHEGEFGFFNKIRAHNFRKFFKTTMSEEGCQRWAAEWMMGHKEELDSRYSNPDGKKMRDTYYIPYVNALQIDTADVIIAPQEDLDALRELQADMKVMREKVEQANEKEKETQEELKKARFAFNEVKEIALKLKRGDKESETEEEESLLEEEKTRKEILAEIKKTKPDVEKNKEIWENFEKSDDPEIIQAKLKAEKSRKRSPDKLTVPIIK